MRRFLMLLIVLAAAGGGAAWYLNRDGATAKPVAAAPAGPPAVPVLTGLAEVTDVPIYLSGLGTVQAFNTVTVKARVDGQIEKIGFVEGQDVKAGDLLAQIDPRPLQAQLAQAQAAKARDEAQLLNAKLDLQRFSNLRDFATQKSVDTQKALVMQLEASIQGDQANIDAAKVQLGYTTMTAPIGGRTGIRLVDQGNIVRAGDATGIVVITQLQPISVIFTLPQEHLDAVNRERRKGTLKVSAVKRDEKVQIGEGTLALVDNQIDQATGAIRLKATFPNDDHTLWPGEFVNARLLLTLRRGAITVPAPVIQRGPDGTYAYVIKEGEIAEIRPVKVGQIRDGVALIEQGLAPGERVVIDGQYKLRNGVRVDATPAKPAAKTGV